MTSPFDIDELFREIDSFSLKEESPRIGISANFREGQSCVADTYIRSVVQAGGAPVIVPITQDLQALSSIVAGLDGLLMTGGGDINPLFLKEEPVPALQDVDTSRASHYGHL